MPVSGAQEPGQPCAAAARALDPSDRIAMLMLLMQARRAIAPDASICGHGCMPEGAVQHCSQPEISDGMRVGRSCARLSVLRVKQIDVAATLVGEPV